MSKHVLIIAEAGVNHNGSLVTAKKMVDAAVDAGVDVIKFQTFNSSKLVSKEARQAEYQKKNIGSGGNDSQLEMLRKLELSVTDHHELVDYCKQKGVMFFSTAFDLDSIDFLHTLGMGLWKIPSGEVTNYPYLKKIAQYGEDVILSTGMCEISDIEDAYEVLVSNGVKKEQITILHCNTEYPTPYEDVNLLAMCEIRDKFGVNVGYSDHTKGIEVPIAAVALGATVIEKHFTLNKKDKGPDHPHSMEPAEFKFMVDSIREVEKAMGSTRKEVQKEESETVFVQRRCLYAKKDLKKGQVIREEDLDVLRPALGIQPKFKNIVIGKTVNKDIPARDPIFWEDI